MSVVGIILARSDSSRLPGKVLTDLGGGRCMLDLVRDRAARSAGLTGLALATSDRPCDDALAAHARDPLGLPVYRGDLEDVAGRALACARAREAEWFVRINGDSPFVDAALLDQGIRLAIQTGADLVTNVLERTYPYGIAVEIFRTDRYQRAISGFDAFEREHIARHYYQRPDQFHIVSLPPSPDPALADVRLTVDDPDDLQRVREIVRRLGDQADQAGFLRVAELAREVQG